MPPSPTATHRLPVILLTGFLGSGKTTLLLRWLSEAPATGRRIGVVMNEFGMESVDSQIINRPGLPISQVSGGCICCVGDDQITEAVRTLVRSGRVDYLVVETSGLADPDNVIDVLTDPELLPEVRLQAVVTIVDSHWFARPAEGEAERVLIRKQVQFAQIVGLSKCDLISAGERDTVEARLAELNPSARRVRLPFGLPDLADILNAPPAEHHVALEPESPGSAPAAHLHSGYRSVTWRFPVPVERSRFEEFLSKLDPREIVRAKGFVRFNRSPDRLHMFQSVFGQHIIDEYPAKPYPEPVAVLIGPRLDADKYTGLLRALVFGGARRVGALGNTG